MLELKKQSSTVKSETVANKQMTINILKIIFFLKRSTYIYRSMIVAYQRHDNNNCQFSSNVHVCPQLATSLFLYSILFYFLYVFFFVALNPSRYYNVAIVVFESVGQSIYPIGVQFPQQRSFPSQQQHEQQAHILSCSLTRRQEIIWHCIKHGRAKQVQFLR